MPWREILNPDQVVGRVFRWFCYALALLLAIPFVVHLIVQIPFLGAALVVCLAACIAVRNRQTRPTRERTIGRAERTPIMPIMEDDE